MKFNIRTRIVLITMSILLLVGGINFVIGRYLFRRELVNSLFAQTTIIGRNMVLQLNEFMGYGNLEGVFDFGVRCEDAVVRYDILTHVMVVSLEGRIMFHNDSDQQGQSVSDLTLLAAVQQPLEKTLLYTYQGEPFHAAVVPVFNAQGRHIAAVVVDFSEDMIGQRLWSVFMYSAPAFLAALGFIAALLSIVLSRGVARPLSRLLDAVRASEQSESLVPLSVDINSPDELGQLYLAVNRLIERARSGINDLEQRMAERVADSEQRAAQLSAAAGIAQVTNSVSDIELLLPQVVNLLAKRFNFYHVGLFLLDDTGEWAVLRASAGVAGRQRLARGYRLAVGFGSVVGHAAEWGMARIASSAEVEMLISSNPDLPAMRSEVALPLRVRNKTVGVLDIYSTSPDAFNDEGSSSLQILADQVALAVSNVQLVRQVQAHFDAERRAYGESSYQAWKELLPARADLSYVSDRQGVTLGSASWEPQMEQALSAGEVIAGGVGESALAIPIKVRGYTIGVVDAQKAGQSGAWSREERVMMQSLIEQLGTAIESARLYQDTQRRATRERTIAEVTGQIRASLELEDVLRAAASEIREAMGLEKIVVRLAVPETSKNKE